MSAFAVATYKILRTKSTVRILWTQMTSFGLPQLLGFAGAFLNCGLSDAKEALKKGLSKGLFACIKCDSMIIYTYMYFSSVKS